MYFHTEVLNIHHMQVGTLHSTLGAFIIGAFDLEYRCRFNIQSLLGLIKLKVVYRWKQTCTQVWNNSIFSINRGLNVSNNSKYILDDLLRGCPNEYVLFFRNISSFPSLLGLRNNVNLGIFSNYIHHIVALSQPKVG